MNERTGDVFELNEYIYTYMKWTGWCFFIFFLFIFVLGTFLKETTHPPTPSLLNVST